MNKLLTAALCAASVACASCTTMPATSSATIERVQARYDEAKAWADLILPYVSTERAARIRLAMALTDQALLAARNASGVAEQRAALARAEAASAAITTTASN